MKVSTQVLLIHLLFIAGFAFAGAILGAPHHIMLALTLAGLLGYAMPGTIGALALKCGNKSEVMQWCAAVASNDGIVRESMRDEVQDIRGIGVVAWFGLLIGTLAAGYIFAATLPICALGAGIGFVLGGLFMKFGT